MSLSGFESSEQDLKKDDKSLAAQASFLRGETKRCVTQVVHAVDVVHVHVDVDVVGNEIELRGCSHVVVELWLR